KNIFNPLESCESQEEPSPDRRCSDASGADVKRQSVARQSEASIPDEVVPGGEHSTAAGAASSRIVLFRREEDEPRRKASRFMPELNARGTWYYPGCAIPPGTPPVPAS